MSQSYVQRKGQYSNNKMPESSTEAAPSSAPQMPAGSVTGQASGGANSVDEFIGERAKEFAQYRHNFAQQCTDINSFTSNASEELSELAVKIAKRNCELLLLPFGELDEEFSKALEQCSSRRSCNS